MRSGPLWAITCLFNPQRYRSRLPNFRVFRERLEVPLIAVELSFDGTFELRDDDADVLVRVSGGDVMWQKERLLNLGRAHLPPECDAVAIVDADVVFTRPDWVEATRNQLRHTPVMQLYSYVNHLPANTNPDNGAVRRAFLRERSWADAAATGEASADDFRTFGTAERGKWQSGYAWAFRRGLLDRHGLYEASIIGGGDTAISAACFGAFDELAERHALTVRQRDYYRAWGEPWFEDVRGRMGRLEGDVLHLWHGSIEDRQAVDRHRRLASHGFDPFSDIAKDEGEAWRWASEKPALHAELARYFAGRREDG